MESYLKDALDLAREALAKADLDELLQDFLKFEENLEHKFIIERNSIMRTDQEIINQTNDLATKFGEFFGLENKSNKPFHTLSHPHAVRLWEMACLAQLELTDTDVRDCFDNLEEDL